MLGVNRIGEIQRAHYREGRSIRGISRDLDVSRTTYERRSGCWSNLGIHRKAAPPPEVAKLADLRRIRRGSNPRFA